MAKNQNIRIRSVQLQADLDALTALQSFADYAPVNPNYAKAALASAASLLKAAQEAEINAINALAAARDAATAAEWVFHNSILGAKDQVIAQYGKNSNQVQALGLKKKSEYKSPRPKKSEPAA